MSHLVTHLNKATYNIFEWYVVCCGSKNRYKKDMCSKEIRLCAQINDVYSKLNINVGTCTAI